MPSIRRLIAIIYCYEDDAVIYWFWLVERLSVDQ